MAASTLTLTCLHWAHSDEPAISGLGWLSHLPGQTGGLFEHWVMAFAPHHPFVDEAVMILRKNLERPEYLMKEDTPEAESEPSVTMHFTGPAMYQCARKVQEVGQLIL